MYDKNRRSRFLKKPLPRYDIDKVMVKVIFRCRIFRSFWIHDEKWGFLFKKMNLTFIWPSRSRSRSNSRSPLKSLRNFLKLLYLKFFRKMPSSEVIRGFPDFYLTLYSTNRCLILCLLTRIFDKFFDKWILLITFSLANIDYSCNNFTFLKTVLNFLLYMRFLYMRYPWFLFK